MLGPASAWPSRKRDGAKTPNKENDVPDMERTEERCFARKQAASSTENVAEARETFQ